jgi:hypothetical protein
VARAEIKEVWQNVTDEALQNWKMVQDTFGWPKLKSPSKDETEEVEIELYGGCFTWHSLLARSTGTVARLIAAGVGTGEIAEIAAGEPELQREWFCFKNWLDALGEHLGFECRAMCVEMCMPDAQKAKIHYHCYLARDWKKWRTPAWAPIKVKKAEFEYMNFTPHISKANLRGAANPKNLITGGLWYCLAPKLGSIFRFSTHQLYKDCSVWACKRGHLEQSGSCPFVCSSCRP